MGDIGTGYEGLHGTTTMPDTNGTTVPVFDYSESAVDGPYRVLQQYHSKPRKLRVACVGAGASGLCLAYKMERMLVKGSWELTLFDKNAHFGGTWYENTYPGVACDIPSHLYTFTFDPNPDWSQFFASGAEIQQYFENFAKRHGSERYMKLNTKVVKAEWNTQKAVWGITLQDSRTGEQWSDWAHCLVNGAGMSDSRPERVLRNWNAC